MPSLPARCVLCVPQVRGLIQRLLLQRAEGQQGAAAAGAAGQQEEDEDSDFD